MLLGRPPDTIFPFVVSFALLVFYLERGLTQIKFKRLLHCPIWLYLSNTLRFNQFKRVNIQTNSFPPLLEDLISEPGGKAFVEPQVAPPTHCHQVSKPLGTMPSGQLDPIGQLDNVQWTIGQLDQNSAFQRAFCQAAHLMCQFMCNNIGNPLLCTGICFLFGVEHLENGDNPDFHPDLNYLR